MRLTAADAVGVVGAGTMGAGIAQVAAAAGHPVLVLDAAPGRAAAAIDEIGGRLERLVGRGSLTRAAADAAAARLEPAAYLAGFAGCALVIEAAAESLDLKRELFTALEATVRDGCVLATNTSSLSVTAIAGALRRPERCVGMHFFNPAPAMRLVEVVSGLATAPEVAAAIGALAQDWGKTAVQVPSTPGFLVNRVARPFYGEALRALEERAADPATIDAVLREAGGFRLGPLALTDLIGQDVNLAVTRSVWTATGYDPRYTPSAAQQALVDAGRLGRKTGAGFFSYRDGDLQSAAAAAPRGPTPRAVRVFGDWGPWRGLWPRVAAAGVDVSEEAGDEPRAELPASAALPAAVVAPTDGRTATERSAGSGRPLVLLDLALDPATAVRFAIAKSDSAPPDVAPSDGAPDDCVRAVLGLLQATGAEVSVLDDVPGLLVARTAAMLVNEAADAVGRGVATAADVDDAMCLGAAYPIGPLAWGDRIGPARVVALLDALTRASGDGRYRVSPTLRRAAWASATLRGLDRA